uniref:response regulator n=1 Tax=Paracoccus seriniphilus TaxID=184748 RepID=UPI00356931A2
MKTASTAISNPANAPRAFAVRRALLVDQRGEDRTRIAHYLRSAGYQLAEADSAAQALEACSRHDPDLIFSAWELPDRKGPEFCR